MKLSLDVFAGTPTVYAEHGNEKVAFTVATYGRGVLQEVPDPFIHINRFWATLPEERQYAIFEIYRRMENCFTTSLSNESLGEHLKDMIAELMAFHPLSALHYWVTTGSYIKIPEKDLCVEYVHSLEKNTSPEKTYTRGEYLWLVTLALAFRPLMPVLAMYIGSIYRQASAKYKEYLTFPLIDKTEIRDSEPMKKLMAYVAATIQFDKINLANILNGMSRDSHGYWFTAVLVIRKLCICPLTSVGPDDNVNLAAMVFRFISTRTTSGESNFAEMVKPKPMDSSTDSPTSGDNQKSRAESYKVTSEISPGEATELAHFVHDPYRLIRRFEPNYDAAYLEAALATANSRSNSISEIHIVLLGWVFARVISPVGFSYIKEQSGQRSKNATLVRCLAVLQTLLKMWGFDYLAIIASSQVNQNRSVLNVSSSSVSPKIKEETYKQLEALYPFRFQTTIRKVTSDKADNLAVKAIDLWTQLFLSESWLATAPDEDLIKVFGTANRRVVVLPHLKEELAQLIIKLNSIHLNQI